MTPESDAVLHQHRHYPRPVELAVNQQANHDGIGDTDGGHLGRGRDTLDHGEANDERQSQRRYRDDEGTPHLSHARAANA
jgi:hypothetical protein